MSQNLHTRVARLEQRRAPRRQYVVRVSDPKTPGDYTAIAADGRPVAVLPHKCGSVEEWAARYPAGALQ
jgi:hypothetical protein